MTGPLFAVKISVIIPCFNELDSIVPCLKGLDTQTMQPNEVIVVDNGSTDGTDTRANAFKPEGSWTLRCIHERQQGPSQARNAGARVANGDILSFLDADCIVSPNYIATLAEELSKDIDACGGFIKEQYSKHDLIGRFLAGFLFYLRPREIYRKVNHISSACFSIKTPWFQRVGGFDESITEGEDVDICLRLFREGARILYNPELWVEHRSAETLWFMICKEYRYARVQPFILKRHYANIFVVELPGKRVLVKGAPHTIVVNLTSVIKPVLLGAVLGVWIGPLALLVWMSWGLMLLCIYVFAQLKRSGGSIKPMEFPVMVLLFVMKKSAWEIGYWSGGLKHRVLVV